MLFRKLAIILLSLSLCGCASVAADAAVAVVKVPIKIVSAAVGAIAGTAAGMANEDMSAVAAEHEAIFSSPEYVDANNLNL